MASNFNVDRSFKIFCDKLSSIHTSNDLTIESSYNGIDFCSNSIIFDGIVDLSKVICNNINISNISEISTKFLIVNSMALPPNIKLKYNSVNDGYIVNTRVGSNLNGVIERSDAFFTYINVSGGESRFNNAVSINNNLLVHGTLNISNDLLMSGTNFTTIDNSFNIYKSSIESLYYSAKIVTNDLSATNISISNDLYVNQLSNLNNISISGILENSALKVPALFTIDPSYNNSGTLIINGNLIVKGMKTTIESNIVDISAHVITIASKLARRLDLSNTNACLDISNVASLKYNGTVWNFTGGDLYIQNEKVCLDVSLIEAKLAIENSFNIFKTDFSSSFNILKKNIENSFNATYIKSQIDTSFAFKSVFDASFAYLNTYLDSSYVSKINFDTSFGIIKTIMDMSYIKIPSGYANFDSSFNYLTSKIDMSYVLKNVFDASYNSFKNQLEISFNNINVNNNISTITIENINTKLNKPLSFVSPNTTISGDLGVTGRTYLKSLSISDKFNFDISVGGYSSNYLTSYDMSGSIVDYYSNVGSTYNKVFKIDACGNVTNYSGIYGRISDSRLKENIVDCSSKLEDLLKIRVVNYKLKDSDSTKYIGVVAQELEELFPELVIEDGSQERFKSVNYSGLTIILIKAFQEQQELINNLITTLEELENN
jgi:hypothetical protein